MRVLFVALCLVAASAFTIKQQPLTLEFKPQLLGDYEKPPCSGAGEIAIRIEGVPGEFCAPKCDSSGSCPTDVPSGVTATPTCALQNPTTKAKYCALICTPGQKQCGSAMKCHSIQGTGVCTYPVLEKKDKSIDGTFD